MDPTRRVLRVGLVVDGVLRDQRLIAPGQPVSLGDSAEHTLLAPLDAPVQLFESRGGVPVLRLGEAMRGRIGGRSGGVPLAALRRDPAVRRRGELWLVPLSGEDQGKIELGGGVSVLFQMAPPPPVIAVGPLPQSDFRPRLIAEEDPPYLGALAAWAVMASVFAVVATHSTPAAATLDSLPEAVRKQVFLPEDLVTVIEPQAAPQPELPPPPPEPEPEPEAVAEAEPAGAPTEAMRAQRVQERMIEESPLLAQVIRSRGDAHAAFATDDRAWLDDVPREDFDDPLYKADGERRELREHTGSTEDADIELTGPTTGPTELEPVDTEYECFLNEPPRLSPSALEDSELIRQVIASNRGALTYCYSQQTRTDPALRGRVEIAFEIAEGKPQAVTVEENTTENNALGECIVDKVRRWRFGAVDTAGQLVEVPMVFAPR